MSACGEVSLSSDGTRGADSTKFNEVRLFGAWCRHGAGLVQACRHSAARTTPESGSSRSAIRSSATRSHRVIGLRGHTLYPAARRLYQDVFRITAVPRTVLSSIMSTRGPVFAQRQNTAAARRMHLTVGNFRREPAHVALGRRSNEHKTVGRHG